MTLEETQIGKHFSSTANRNHKDRFRLCNSASCFSLHALQNVWLTFFE